MAAVLQQALRTAVADPSLRLVLAVSGGRDSMALLHAAARWCPASIAAVATFDHGSDPMATDAAALVVAEARRLGFSVVRERARALQPTEAAWREARWAFLRRVARAYGASVATAHTRDDQLETIVLRLLRGTGARGLAALAVPGPVVRPWLLLGRADVAAWAAGALVPFVEDPSNSTRRYARSRVRADLLPALEAAHPGFGRDMLAIGDRAAVLRSQVDALADSFGLRLAPPGSPPGAIRLSCATLEALDRAGLGLVWPALMARCGVALNRRGTMSLIAFTGSSRAGQRLELAGTASVVRVREGPGDVFELRGARGRGSKRGSRRPKTLARFPSALPERFRDWQFVLCSAPPSEPNNFWYAALPEGAAAVVRAWVPGDRINTPGAPAGRRVARYLSEAHVPPVDRTGWPVVLVGEEIVWVPGVCRSPAAPNRPGRPNLIWYRCEREHG